MSANKDLARKAIEMWAADSHVDRSIFSPSYRNHQEPLAKGGVAFIDLDTWADVVEAVHRAFPDLKVEIISQTAEDERVSTHWRFHGTYLGPYLDRSATGRKVSWMGIQIDRISDGLIEESVVVWDFHSLLVQLGWVEDF
ncbi:MAG: ester cyclase [Pseudomonadota bacterium]